MANEAEERVTPIRITDTEKHKEYVLDFTRDTVAFAEDRGFDWDLMGSKPATMVPLIWWVAFRRYQPSVSRLEADRMLEDIGGMTESIMVRLRLLYDQSLESLINEEDAPKNGRMMVQL